MTARSTYIVALLAASSPLALAASPAWAQAQAQAGTPAQADQTTPTPAPTPSTARPRATPTPTPTGAGASLNDDSDDTEIVVTGQKERGAVVGDVKPLQQLDAGDVRALGVSSVSDLITELGPQVQSASGKPPIMLLEGHRLSSPNEINTLPSEAIQRVDILPEEVGLRYGYDADQKVINIVLRQRFRALDIELNGRVPTAKSGVGGNGEVGFLSIRNGARFNLTTQLKTQDDVLETDRGLDGPDSQFRTLSPSDTQLTVTSTYHRPLTEKLAGTLNGQVVTEQSLSEIGTDDGINPTQLHALERATNTFTDHLSFGLTRDHAKGQITLTGNYDHSYSRSLSDRAFDENDSQPPTDVALSYTDTGSLDLLYNTALATLAAGDISLTSHLSGSTSTFRSVRISDLVSTPSRIRRDTATESVNLTVPIAGPTTPLGMAIGRLQLSGQFSLNEMSDAGTVHSYGMSLNWQPTKIISVTGNYTDRQNAPSASQLGSATVVTANVPVFDYVRGETVNVSTISGGNPDLANSETRSFRIGVSVSPFKDPQVNFQVDLSHTQTTGGISALPGITLDTENAFASRFVRDGSGVLTSVDLRPINIAEQKSTQLRWGINFTKQLKTPQKELKAFQDVIRKRIQDRINSGQIPPEVAARLQQALNSGNLQQLGQVARQVNGPNGQGGQQGQGGQAGQGNGTTPAQGGANGAQPQGQGGNGNPTVIIAGGPDGVPPPGAGQGGNFVFQGAPGGGGPGGGGFRGPPGGFGGGGFGGGFGGGGFGGGGGGAGGVPRGGRLNFSIYHTWIFDSTTQLAPMLPVIDLLDGGTLGGGAGPSQHQIQVQGGYSKGAIGYRGSINWNSATHVDGTGGLTSDLRFGALTKVSLRAFINFSQLPKVIDKTPFFRGSRLTIGVDNLFDARQKVTDGTGATPYAYQGPFLDPTGRVISIGFRKLFF